MGDALRLERDVAVRPTLAAASARDAVGSAPLNLRIEADYALARVLPAATQPDFYASRWMEALPTRSTNASGARTLQLLLSTSLTHDSNVFRLPGNISPQLALGLPSRSDTITVAAVGLRIDKDYAQQRFELDVTETAYRYAQFSFLNFNALEYRGVWHWHVTPRWTGTVSSEHQTSLASSADTTQIAQRAQRNLRTSDQQRFTLDGSLWGGWHALLGVFQAQQKYDQGLLPQNSSRTQGVEAGAKYVSPSGSALSLVQRAGRGEYLNRVADAATVSDNAFRQNDTELKLDWNLSAKSVLRNRLTWINVHHEHFAVRNYSGLAGEMAYGWLPTGKLRLEIAARRDLSTWWQSYSSYKIDNTLSVAPVWQVAANTTVRLRLDRTHSEFLEPVAAVVGALRRDAAHSVLLGVAWSPLRSLMIDASLQHQQRSSNYAGIDFDTSMASINAKLKF